MKVKSHIFLFGVLVILSGCSGVRDDRKIDPDRYLMAKQTKLIKEGKPITYVAGYMEGCTSGRRIAGDIRFVYRKNPARFERDALYARGWQEGQINCRNEVIEEHIRAEKKKNSSYFGIDEEKRRRLEAESRAAEAAVNEIWEELKK